AVLTSPRLVAEDEVVEIGPSQLTGLEGKVLVRPEVVDPQLLCPRCLLGRLAVEEEHVRLDATGIEDARGQAQQCVDVALLEQLAPDDLPGAAFEENVVRNHDRRAAMDREQRVDVLEEVELLVAGADP